MKKYAIISMLLVLAYSCTQTNKTASNQDQTVKLSEAELSEAASLIENKCYTCHSPNAAMDNRMAPPMVAIKRHYTKGGTTQEEFTKNLIAFVSNPSAEKSKMPEAIEKFNLMPKMNFNEEDLKKIAAYIYQEDIEKPGWFEKHMQEEKSKENMNKNSMTSEKPLEQGKEIAMQAKAALSENLLAAIKAKGVANAVTFCSTKAISITDSVGKLVNAKIRRVSDKNRNPNNAANKEELAYIMEVKNSIAKNLPLKPKLLSTSNSNIGYYPILTNKTCLQCHGSKDMDIAKNTLSNIKSIYPKDKATGYKEGELRGIWVIEMIKNNQKLTSKVLD
ncbi:MAG: DUF3365 domain-containing protein [Sphingobacteriales bacterium]|nr:DUF3365 domain-containing protein [Sphingobacteriales bacterium]